MSRFAKSALCICLVALLAAPSYGQLDIKPGSCLNPVNVRSRGILPMVLFGHPALDAAEIDPATIQLSRVFEAPAEGEEAPAPVLLEGVVPVRWRLCDLGDWVDDCAVEPPETEEELAQALEENGMEDLVLMFKTEEIVAALEGIKPLEDGEQVTLLLTAFYNASDDETLEEPQVVEDVAADVGETDTVLVIKKSPRGPKPGQGPPDPRPGRGPQGPPDPKPGREPQGPPDPRPGPQGPPDRDTPPPYGPRDR